MKFPLPHAPFGDYPALSEAQAEQIELVVQQTLSETLSEYEPHQQKQRRLLPRSQYKVVKKVENLICYRRRPGVSPEGVTPASHPSPACTNSSSLVSSARSASYAYTARNGHGESHWRAPNLVTVGTMAGTLDDVMYGLLATDATSTFIRASYTNKELLDSELLHCIQFPTSNKPFQFCGVKWHVLELTKITSKRDFVFVEASGVVDRPNGERVGYHIMHSVDLPGLGELSDKYQVLRARVVSCHLFRQLPNSTVDVYMKGLVDPSGHMPGAVAIASTVSALLKFSQAVECSHSKKLEYMLEQEQFRRAGTLNRTSDAGHVSSRSSVKSAKLNGSSKPCAVCATTLHLFRSVACCELCSEAVCSRCRVTRRLSYRVARPKELKQQNIIFCTTCIAKASAYSAADVARSELGAQSSIKKNTSNTMNNLVSTGNQLKRFLTSSTLSSNNTALSSSNYSRLETSVEEDKEEELSSRRRSLDIDSPTVPVRRRSVTHPPVSREKVEIEMLCELDLTSSLSVVSSSSDYLDEDFYENEAGRRKTQPPNAFSDLPEFEPVDPLACSMPPKPSASAMNSQLRHQRELMRRMEVLRQNAENVYQLTRRNTQSMQCGGVPLHSQSVCITTGDLD
ncbi:hypothetical protein JG687_00012405 [Phytophthora cactorum]|uniref:START-like domain n=1 Tax=Phytophthora cactorum TaxID=29920 RepID=A0A8T1U1Z7_9STRA|nr:hypothetical protein PC120_g11415 [Phytophthora cactorum]KAG3061344.1 hypothetical protein PC121_g13052 [Phytophthora cactorum]KAG3189000.1 hypothetical protein PC128_g11935 [Phytophthora cactorum]KAG4053707.1 hypothetical protein PC123_g11160 [Phytophthora cactorum]KAG6953431.1 hypothetical protein JG687_00012405 [Phytophthora cactorum]